jgi:CheY-like chemotaxis protein
MVPRISVENRQGAFSDLCLKYDFLLMRDALSPSERMRAELSAYARILDLEVGGTDAAEIWRRVRPLIAREFADDGAQLASPAAEGLIPKVYLPCSRGMGLRRVHGHEPLTLLVVEDDPDLGPAMVEALVEAGHRVVAHSVGADVAAAQAALHDVELAIVDVELEAGFNGVHLARVLHERWGIPALFVSGSQNEHLITLSHAVGFLGKPFKLAELLAAVTLASRLLRDVDGKPYGWRS